MKIQNFIDRYRKGTVQITDNVSYNTRDVIKENIRLWHGKFEDDTFADGTKKIFYNTLYIYYDTVYRNTDLDTKSIMMHSLNGNGFDVLAVLKLAVRSWMKRGYFGPTLNEIRQELISMGHVLVKMVDGKPYVVNLLNTVIPPHVSSVQDSGLVEEIHWTWDDMLEHKEDFKDNWEEITEVWNRLQKEDQPYFKIYEHWRLDDFRTKEEKEKDDGKELNKLDKGCVQYLDINVLQEESKGDPSEWDPYLELKRFKSPYKRRRFSKADRDKYGEYEVVYPYLEQQLIKIKGRYLGLGLIELCAGVAEDYNETMNLGRKFRKLQLRGILLHRQPAEGNRSVSQEFIANVDTGAIIDLEEGENLERINMGSNTVDIINHIDKLFEIGRQLTGTTSQGTLEDAPASTTATVAVLNQQQARTTYDVVIEQQSLFLTQLFQDFILPQIIEEFDAEEVIAITGDTRELETLDRRLSTKLVMNNIEKTYKKTGIVGFVENGQIIPVNNQEEVEFEVDRLMQQLKETGDNRYPKIKKELLKDIDYMVEFVVDNESFDKNTRIQNILSLLKDPNYSGSRRQLEAEMYELLGFTGRKFEKTKREMEEEAAQIQMRSMAENAGSPDTSVSGENAGTIGNNFANNNQA